MFSLHLAGVSSILGAVNFIATTINIRQKVWRLKPGECDSYGAPLHCPEI
jgi:hypothetical protein